MAAKREGLPETLMEQILQCGVGSIEILCLFFNNDENIVSLNEPILFSSQKLSAHPLLIISDHCISNLFSYGKADANMFLMVGCNNHGILSRIIPLPPFQ